MFSDIGIRMARPGDEDAIAEIYAPAVVGSAISFESEPPDAAEMRRRIDATLPTLPWLVAMAPERGVVGYAYASPYRRRAAYRWSAEVSVYVASDSMRRGVARRLYETLIDRLERQGYRTLVAGITLPNAASVAFHEALGFTPAGLMCDIGWKSGRWHDVGLWQRRVGGDGPPVEPGPAPAAP